MAAVGAPPEAHSRVATMSAAQHRPERDSKAPLSGAAALSSAEQMPMPRRTSASAWCRKLRSTLESFYCELLIFAIVLIYALINFVRTPLRSRPNPPQTKTGPRATAQGPRRRFLVRWLCWRLSQPAVALRSSTRALSLSGHSRLRPRRDTHRSLRRAVAKRMP